MPPSVVTQFQLSTPLQRHNPTHNELVKHHLHHQVAEGANDLVQMP